MYVCTFRCTWVRITRALRVTLIHAFLDLQIYAYAYAHVYRDMHIFPISVIRCTYMRVIQPTFEHGNYGSLSTHIMLGPF
jgi:hypothetical protein